MYLLPLDSFHGYTVIDAQLEPSTRSVGDSKYHHGRFDPGPLHSTCSHGLSDAVLASAWLPRAATKARIVP